MKFSVVTLFPEQVQSITECGVIGRGFARGLLSIDYWNPRAFAPTRYAAVDDRPFGGGPGMVMQMAPLQGAIQAAKQAHQQQAHCVYLSPQGQRLTQQGVQQLLRHRALILVCGRYEGVDERLIEAEVDQEVSLGDYVISGGELAAMVMIDAVARLVPGVLGHPESAVEDSHMQGLLDCPHYTRPEVIAGRTVPQVLLSGDHARIRRWRMQQSLGRTWLRRPDLLASITLTPEQQALLDEFKDTFEQP